MFDALSSRLQSVFASLRREGRLTPELVETALKEIRLALLEADVNVKVVKAFIDRVRDRANSGSGSPVRDGIRCWSRPTSAARPPLRS